MEQNRASPIRADESTMTREVPLLLFALPIAAAAFAATTTRRAAVSTAAAAAAARRPAPVFAAFTEADYLADPTDITSAALPEFSQRDVFLNFHGRGGPDREDADLEARVRAQDRRAGLDRFVHVIVWKDLLEAASTERISYLGQALGRKMGRTLALRKNLRSLHVCGTSAGAFAANECITAYVEAAGAKRRSAGSSLGSSSWRFAASAGAE